MIQNFHMIGLNKIMKCVILAGGKGTRISELSKSTPKPMINVLGEPIIVKIMKQYSKYGIKDFFFTIRYKMEIIKAYFNDTKSNFRIRYLEEKKPLGTAGGLRKLYGKIFMIVIMVFPMNNKYFISIIYQIILGLFK